MKKLLHQSVSVSLALAFSCAAVFAGYGENNRHRRDDILGKASQERGRKALSIPSVVAKDMDIKRVENVAEEDRMRRCQLVYRTRRPEYWALVRHCSQ